MCGIAGIINLNGNPVSTDMLKKMTDAMIHRGPDSEGFYIEDSVGLGHRRLSIIDLSKAGHQPISTPDGNITVSYNGEVYNFQELRIELENLGHRFQSRTDSEVVLHAYQEWGTESLNRFNGMFAFIIWDKSNKELFIARDRYGIKPLYYMFTRNAFLAASEQKAILAHPDARRSIDTETLLEYFTFQNIFTDRTFIKDIKLFPAGCWAKIKADMPVYELKLNRYWDFTFEEPNKQASEQEYIEELDRLFQQAVTRQLVSDVDLGAYLSGGMDSGSITAVAASRLPYMKSFTCGFDLHSASGLELAFDEREKAEYMSYLFKTEHYEMVLKAGDMERVMPELAWHIEEPRVGQSYPNYYAAKLASRFVKVVLSGGGGDELFGGYPWRYYRAVVNDGFENYIDRYYHYWQRLIDNKDIRRIFAPIWKEVNHVHTRDIFKGVFKKHEHKLECPEDYVNHSLYFESKTFLHGLLVIEDKLSMAHSLETRLPFLDNDLVDFAMHLPVKYKLKKLSEASRINENDPRPKPDMYFQKHRDGKVLLRKVMGKHIPEAITEAEKQGFSAPDASWFKGESIDYVRRIILDSNARIYSYMDRKAVMELVNDHLEGRRNRRLFIWSLLNFEWWLRGYINQNDN